MDNFVATYFNRKHMELSKDVSGIQVKGTKFKTEEEKDRAWACTQDQVNLQSIEHVGMVEEINKEGYWGYVRGKAKGEWNKVLEQRKGKGQSEEIGFDMRALLFPFTQEEGNGWETRRHIR